MKNISQVSPWVDNQELSALEKSITEKWLTEGPHTKVFIEKLIDLTGSKYILPVPNGTLGLFMALLAFDPKEGDEIIIPSFTFFGSASAAHFAGFKPVFCDVNPVTFMMDLEDLKKKITSKTKVVMPVNIYGKSHSFKSIIEFCRSNKIFVLEDGAQSIGVFNGEGIHSSISGDIGVISFFADKTITTGEGGIVLVQDKTLYEKLKLIRNQGRPNSGTFVHPSFGMNFRITDMQAGLGSAQLDKLDKIINFKRGLFSYYDEKIKNHEKIIKPKIKNNNKDVPFRYYFQIKKDKHLLIEYLESKNIQTRSFFYPMHLQPSIISKYGPQSRCPVSEELNKTGLCLPLHHELTKNDINYIAECINNFIDKSIIS